MSILTPFLTDKDFHHVFCSLSHLDWLHFKKTGATNAMPRLIITALLFFTSAQASDIKIIVSGQSNAVGWAEGSGPASDPRILAWDPAQRNFITASEPLPFWTTPDPGTCGAWVFMAKTMLKQFDTVRLIGAGKGGQSITYWDEGNEGWTNLSNAIVAGGADAQYFIWYQGEADVWSLGVLDYASKLANLFARVRDLTRPDLPVLVVQLADSPDAPMPAMREIQYDYCVSDDRAYLIQTLGFPLQADNLHLTVAGYSMLGHACAKHILGAMWFKGDRGPKGDSGAKGDQGEKGDTGPKGLPGKDGKDWTPPAGMLIFMQHGSSAPDNSTFLRFTHYRQLKFDIYSR